MKKIRLSSVLLILALAACASSPEEVQQSAGYAADGKVLLAARQSEQAREAYRDAVSADPDNARAWNGLGVAEDMLGNSEDALEDYRRAAELAPDDLSIANNLGHAYLSAGQPALTVHVLQPFSNRADAPAALRQNLERAIAQLRTQQSLANGDYADLGSSPTDSMAQAHVTEAKGLIGPMAGGLVFTIDPDEQVMGGVPVYTIKVTGMAPQRICDMYNAKAMPCIPHGK